MRRRGTENLEEACLHLKLTDSTLLQDRGAVYKLFEGYRHLEMIAK